MNNQKYIMQYIMAPFPNGIFVYGIQNEPYKRIINTFLCYVMMRAMVFTFQQKEMCVSGWVVDWLNGLGVFCINDYLCM